MGRAKRLQHPLLLVVSNAKDRSHGTRLSTLEQLAEHHGFTTEALRTMLAALIVGNGSMANFNHPEFGGIGQWMSGGMAMTSSGAGDLRRRVDWPCEELVRLLGAEPEFWKLGVVQSARPPSQRMTGKSVAD